MPKYMSVLFLSLILVLSAAVGYLSKQVLQLNQLYSTLNVVRSQGFNPDQVSKTIDILKEDVKNQEKTITAIETFVASLTKQSPDNPQGFLPAPLYVTTWPVYQTKEANNTITVVGNKRLLLHWINRNEVYFDYVLKKSLPLEYDRTKGGIVVQNIIPHSIFYQMGLRNGDRIVMIDGVVINKGPELREKLLDLKTKNVVVARDNKRLTFALSYQDQPQNEIVLNITRDQFIQRLTELTSTLKVTPVQDGNVQGVKITEINPDSTFAVMNLQVDDVITKVNGNNVTTDQLATAFQTATEPLQIDFLRNNEPTQISVKFSGTTN